MKRIISLLLLAAMLLSLCACGAKEEAVVAEAPEASEEPIESSAEDNAAQAAELFFAGNYDEAFKALCALEGSGLQIVNELLAMCHYYGYGTGIAADTAVDMLEPLAENGSCIASYLLGKASFSGNGAVQNPDKAMELFKNFVDDAGKLPAEDPLRASVLAAMTDCYANGLGVERDTAKAIELAGEAAANGRLSVFESFDLAAVVIKIAETHKARAEAVVDEHGFTSIDAMKQKLEERKLGIEAPDANPQFAPIGEEQTAQYMADITTYENVFKDLDTAEQLMALANKLCSSAKSGISALADEGNIIALKYMGDYYFDGLGNDSKDYSKAMEYYMQAADFDYAPAQAQIALMYQDGLGVDVSYEQAMEWNNRAAQQGNAQGQAQIGYLYHMGLGVTQNLNEAGRWYSRAADQGDEWAAAKLKETELTNPQLAFEFHA